MNAAYAMAANINGAFEEYGSVVTMNREFLDLYNRELTVLREQAAEFAAEYPGVTERLGGLVADRMDPMISGLLEGSAFLAARVQLKLKHEFADFTTNLIDQLTPQYLAPTPSFLLTELAPKFGDPALREGRTIPRGAYFEATAAIPSTMRSTASSRCLPIFPARRRRRRWRRSIRLPPASAARGCVIVRRLPRRRSSHEAKFGRKSDYTGTEMVLSPGQRADTDDAQRVTEISLRALCTNRHRVDRLPVGQGGADFRLLDDVTLEMRCVAGPTRPREPPMTAMAGKIETASTGEIAWRLINMLSLNHLGLVDRGPEEGAVALRETLMLFADLSDGATERRIHGVRGLQAKPIVRRIRTPQGAAAARGLELTVLIDDKAFEGSGAFLIGAALDRFFAEYVAINHFTQTVVCTSERGEIMRWPPRLGLRGSL